MKSDRVSEHTTSRLSVYLRCLNELAAEDERYTSSAGMARRFHLNSAQIRKDLAYFGEFGTRGVGYEIENLRRDLTRILGLDREHRIGIIGAGRLGMALADYYELLASNFTVIALFDVDKRKIGKKAGAVPIFDIKSFAATAKRDKIDVAVIAVPAGKAQTIVDLVSKAGVKAVMNFAPVTLKAADGVKLRSIDLTKTLESLSYFLAQASVQNGST
jgi:redox-sensing transcriptional repressor